MKTFEYEPLYKKTVLENGVRVVTEHHPFSRAVCAGIFVDLGTRDEPEDLNGAAHFVEHMVFKGTETRDAYEIVRSLEAVGGDLNAYTTRESTCFHATCLKEHLPLALDLLADLMCNATFDTNDIKKEREVILQEINMSTDSLDEHIYDLCFELVFKGHDLGRPILGTARTLNNITRKKLMDFYQRRYQGKNMVVAVAGHVDHEEVVAQVKRTLSLRRKPFQEPPRRKPSFRSFAKAIYRPAEQAHFLMALPSCSAKDENRFASYIVNAALGGGMTSRLYQKIRERSGLSYSVYSYLQPFVDTGLLMLYAGTSGKNLQNLVGMVMREIESLKKKGLSVHELEFFKRQVIGSFILECDDIENRMNALGHYEMTFNDYRPVDAAVKDIEAVTTESVQAYLKKYCDLDKMGLLVLGDCNEDRTQRYLDKLLEKNQ